MQGKLRYSVMFLLVLTMLACKGPQVNSASVPAPGMFKVAVLYPNGDDKTFDMDYYEKKHMPMVAGLLGQNLKFYEIDKGIAGRTPSDKVPFVAVGYFYVTDVAEYGRAIAANREAVLGDIKNYTNIQPVVNISEIRQMVPNTAK